MLHSNEKKWVLAQVLTIPTQFLLKKEVGIVVGIVVGIPFPPQSVRPHGLKNIAKIEKLPFLRNTHYLLTFPTAIPAFLTIPATIPTFEHRLAMQFRRQFLLCLQFPQQYLRD